MAYLGNHAATDSRDRIFSVLGLVTAQDRQMIGAPEYSSSTQNQFAKLVRSFWDAHGNLDIICFVHLFNRCSGPIDPGFDTAVPTWTPDWRSSLEYASPVPLMASQSSSEHIGNFRPLRSMKSKAAYDAPGSQMRKRAHVSFSEDLKDLWCKGAALDTIHGLGGLDDRELRCKSFVCAQQSHDLCQSETGPTRAPRATMLPMDWMIMITFSLVLDRQDKYLCHHASQDYVTDFLFLCRACIAEDPVDWSFSTWFSHNRHLRFGSQTMEELIRLVPLEPSSFPPRLHRPDSYPTKLADNTYPPRPDTFLSRFHDTVRKKARRLFVTKEGLVGVAPCRAREGDIVAVLFACNVPLVLRKREGSDAHYVLGEAYVHDYMNGEVGDLVKRGKTDTYRFHLI
jgi:hypothetical protein